MAVVNQLWEEWQLSEAFTFDITRGERPLHKLPKIVIGSEARGLKMHALLLYELKASGEY